MARKVYVDVTVIHHKDGSAEPLSFVWEDGAVYEIARVTDARPAASLKVGGFGVRYTCVIEGREKYLFQGDANDSGRWFMEGK